MRKLEFCGIDDQELLDAKLLVENFNSRGFELDLGSAICAWRKYSQACGSNWEPMLDDQQAFLSAYTYLHEVFA